MNRVRGWLVGPFLAVGFYLLLIDTTDLPELYAALGGLVLVVGGWVAARQQGGVEAGVPAAWLFRGERVFAGVPRQIVLLCVDAVSQLVTPRAMRGSLRAVPFRAGGGDARDLGRRALAEGLGSLAPNTIVVGVDPERDLLLIHQLHREGGRDAADVLGLG